MPPSRAGSRPIRPPCASTIRRHVARPTPVPGTACRAAPSARRPARDPPRGLPRPLSTTSTRHCPPAARDRHPDPRAGTSGRANWQGVGDQVRSSDAQLDRVARERCGRSPPDLASPDRGESSSTSRTSRARSTGRRSGDAPPLAYASRSSIITVHPVGPRARRGRAARPAARRSSSSAPSSSASSTDMATAASGFFRSWLTWPAKAASRRPTSPAARWRPATGGCSARARGRPPRAPPALGEGVPLLGSRRSRGSLVAHAEGADRRTVRGRGAGGRRRSGRCRSRRSRRGWPGTGRRGSRRTR